MTDVADARDTGPRVGSPLWIYIAAATAAGAGVFMAALAGLKLADLRTLVGSPLWWMLALLVICGELRPIVTPGKSAADAAAVSLTFSFAALIYWGLPAAAVLQSAAALIAGTAARHAPFRNAFNAAQYTISLGAASVALAVCGVHPAPARPWVPASPHLAQIALAAGAFFTGNLVLVGIAVALHARAPLVATIRADLPYQLLVNVALLSAAPLVVVVMNRSAALLPLFLLPLVAVYTNAATSMNRAHQAMHDELTGLPNRKLLILRAAEALTTAGRLGHHAGLLLLDLDRFKEVNDSLGHPTGDRLLAIVAHRLGQTVRPGDVVARLGGDEFAVLLPRVRDTASAREVATRLRAALAEPIRMDAMSFDMEASVGIALYPDHASGFELLLQRADVAMYLAKERRSGVETYSADQDRNSPARLGLLGELRRAVHTGELELYFEPKTMLADGRTIGMEAHVTWRHPVSGLIAAEEIMPRAEHSYLQRELTRHIIDIALDQAAVWWRASLRVQVAVGISASDLCDPALAEMITSGLRRRLLPPGALQLAISERVLKGDPAHVAGSVNILARAGIALSLDAFGTGYASLVRLKRLPVWEIKIDPSFVERMLDNHDDRVIVQSLVGLVRALRIRSVAGGVGTAAIAAALRQMGCDAAQGRHVSGPLDTAAATAWLAERPPVAPPDPGPHPAAGMVRPGIVNLDTGRLALPGTRTHSAVGPAGG